MSKDTKEIKPEENKAKRQEKKSILKPKEKMLEKQKKSTKIHTIENKSVQNKVIENIKNFISKIIEVQEKVRQDEKEEKQLDRKSVV